MQCHCFDRVCNVLWYIYPLDDLLQAVELKINVSLINEPTQVHLSIDLYLSPIAMKAYEKK